MTTPLLRQPHSRSRMLVLLAVVALALTATASALVTTAPAKNGRIAFVRLGASGDSQASQIIVVNANGSGEQTLTPSGYRDDMPDWSPNGSRIIFQRCTPTGGACLIWSAKPDGTGLKRLSVPCPAPPACADDRSPAYSPDGRRIAFIRTKATPVLMVADGKLKHPRRVIEIPSSGGSPYSVTWSPDGKQLAFASGDDGGRALYDVNANGTGVRRLTPWTLQAGGRPDWSPDGGRILFRSNSNRLGGFGVNLYTVRPDGTGLRQLTHIDASNRVLDGAYSPNGVSIAFSTTVGATDPTLGQPDIFVIRADGTGAARPVTRSENWDGSPDWGPRP